MKRFYFLIVFLLTGLCGSFAAEMWNAKTPVQVYQEAGSEAETAAQSPAASAPPQTVNNPPVIPPPIYHNPAVLSSSLMDDPMIKLMKQELIQLNRNMLLFQQTTNNKIDDLEKELATVQARLKQVAQAFVMLNKDVSALKQGGMSTSVKLTSTPWFPWPIIVAGSIVAALLLMLIIWLWRRKSVKVVPTAEKTAEKQDDTEDEYDYIGSDEGIAAKLNLARAYIAMEDYAAAKKIIDEVLLNGDEQQRLDAAALAKTLPDQKAGS